MATTGPTESAMPTSADATGKYSNPSTVKPNHIVETTNMNTSTGLPSSNSFGLLSMEVLEDQPNLEPIINFHDSSPSKLVSPNQAGPSHISKPVGLNSPHVPMYASATLDTSHALHTSTSLQPPLTSNQNFPSSISDSSKPPRQVSILPSTLPGPMTALAQGFSSPSPCDIVRLDQHIQLPSSPPPIYTNNTLEKSPSSLLNTFVVSSLDTKSFLQNYNVSTTNTSFSSTYIPTPKHNSDPKLQHHEVPQQISKSLPAHLQLSDCGNPATTTIVDGGGSAKPCFNIHNGCRRSGLW